MKRILLLSFCLATLAGGTGYVCSGSTESPPRTTISLTRADIEKMIADFGPIIYLHRDERYLMDDPEYFLDHGVDLQWGIVENELDYNLHRSTKVHSAPTSASHLMSDVRAYQNSIESDPDQAKYKCWLHVDETVRGGSGSLERAKALIHVLPLSTAVVEMQFWFFYPFNGAGKAFGKLWDGGLNQKFWCDRVGRHYGDWEHVSLLISVPKNQLTKVYISRHDGGEVFNRVDEKVFRSTTHRGDTLRFEGLHPVIYSADGSHAHWEGEGDLLRYKRIWQAKWRLGTTSLDLFDLANSGPVLRTYEPAKYRIIASDLLSVSVAEPDWLNFPGRWGQYEMLNETFKIKGAIAAYTQYEVGAGPSGPKMKEEWATTPWVASE